MTVTIPLTLAIAIAVIAVYRSMGLKPWHVLVFTGLVYLLLSTSIGPEIQTWLNSLFHGGHK